MKKLKIIKKKMTKKKRNRITQYDIRKLDLIIFVLLNTN